VIGWFHDLLLSWHTDIEAQGAALGHAARQRLEANLSGKYKLIRVSGHSEGALGLSHRMETQLAKFRTDFDSPSWQEIHALLLHGAAVAAKEIDGGIPTNESSNQIRDTISTILAKAGGPVDLAEPQESDLTACHKRPTRRLLFHGLCVAFLLAIELSVFAMLLWYLVMFVVLHERLMKVAKDMGLSVSALVEKIIDENLEQYEGTGAKVRRVLRESE
jgi:hypothetical protein